MAVVNVKAMRFLMNFFVKNSFSKNKITLAVAVFFSSASLSMVAQAQTEQNIRIAYNLPSDHATGKYFEVLADEIKSRTMETSIRLIPQTFSDGQLFNDEQLPSAIGSGAAHIGQVNLGFVAGRSADLLRVWALPLLYETWEAQWAAEDSELFWNTFDSQLMELDHKMLGWPSYGTVEIYTNQPVYSPEDLKGMRIRSFGIDTTEYLNEIGASPVGMSSQEIYQAMQRRTIDGYTSGPSSVLSRSLYEVSSYGTNIGLGRLSFVSSANLTWWESLPADVQNAVIESSKVATNASRMQAKESSEKELTRLQDLGVEVLDIDSDIFDLWLKSAELRRESYAESNGDTGLALLEIIDQSNARFPNN